MADVSNEPSKEPPVPAADGKLIRVRRALITVSDKTGVVELARRLEKLGVEILSTGGTGQELARAGVRALAVSEVTGFPEILSGRVKTLHPLIHAGILALREDPAHMAQLEEHCVQLIDLVVVNLYPFQATVSKKGVSLEEAIENIDIGGPSLIRAAAKNAHNVAVVVDPGMYPLVLEELETLGGIRPRTSRSLARQAFGHTASYDSAIHIYLEAQEPRQESETTKSSFPGTVTLEFTKLQDLRYGENPHQRAALYAEARGAGRGVGLHPASGGLSVVGAKQLQGKELSFNNIVDANAALAIVAEFEEPACVAVKHTNPCGVAVGENLLEAYTKVHDADPVSIFGGVAACNRPLGRSTAERMAEVFLEIVLAPQFDEEALAVFSQKKNLRLLEIGAVMSPSPYLDFKRIAGGILIQDADVKRDDRESFRVVTRREPEAAEWYDLLFGWRVVRHVRSNAIVIAEAGVTLGIGAGQMNRIQSARLAIAQAGAKARGAVLCSDGFFPFPDAVEAARDAEITAIIQPGGSVKDEDSVKAADKAGIAMVFTGTRHFSH